MPTQGYKGQLVIDGNDVDVAKDANLTIEATELDVTQRGDNGLMTFQPGQFNASIEFSLGNDTDDARWSEIQAAYANRTTLDNVRIRDGETPEFYVELTSVHVLSFSKAQGLDEEQIWSGTMKPATRCVLNFV